jgi:hypothetical protein
VGVRTRSSAECWIISKNASGVIVESGRKAGTNAVEYFHGIHNSHNMPGSIYYRSLASDETAGAEDRYSIGYPSDVRNCKVCHTTPGQLAAAGNAPVSFVAQTWDGFGASVAEGGSVASFHRPLGMSGNCAACHDGSVSTKQKASDFHNSFEGADAHLDSYYGGTDISFDNPDNVLFSVTGVTKSGDNVAFTWTATKNGAAVNPCNTDNAVGPTFQI